MCAALQATVRDAAIAPLWMAAEAEVKEVIATADYGRALQIFSHKGLVELVGNVFGLKTSQFVRLVKQLLLSDQRAPTLVALRINLPTIAF